jgi:hypothetical protein
VSKYEISGVGPAFVEYVAEFELASGRGSQRSRVEYLQSYPAAFLRSKAPLKPTAGLSGGTLAIIIYLLILFIY